MSRRQTIAAMSLVVLLPLAGSSDSAIVAIILVGLLALAAAIYVTEANRG